MPSPIKPSDIKSTLPQTSTPVCSRLKNLLVDFPKAIYQWFSYMYNEDGTFTEEFKDEVCTIDCKAVIVDGPEKPCDPATEDCEDTTGNLAAPTVTAGSAMRWSGGIPLVWMHVSGARAYNLYRATSNSTAAAVLLRKGLEPHKGSGTNRNKLYRRSDTSLVIVDTSNGLAWDEVQGRHVPTSTLAPATAYYYWVRTVDSSRNLSGWSNGVLGFSRNVPSYDVITADDGDAVRSGSDESIEPLLWSGEKPNSETHTTPANAVGLFPKDLDSKTRMRVTLRGGGGGGGGGGDYAMSTFTKFYIKNIDYNTTQETITVELSDHVSSTHGFANGFEVRIEGSGTTSWNRTFTVRQPDHASQKFTLEYVGNLGPPLTEGSFIPTTSNLSYGTVYATALEHPVMITGGGGGGGGLVQAVFAIASLKGVRVRTYDVNGVAVDYSAGKMQEDKTKAPKLDNPTNSGHLRGLWLKQMYFPINQGGRGRYDASATVGKETGPPTSGVPSSGDKYSYSGATEGIINQGSPFITVLEVTTDNFGGSLTWKPILWVSDGGGGGYKNGVDSTNLSVGGQGSSMIWWKESVFTDDSPTDVFKATETGGFVQARYGYKDQTGATLRTAALDGKGIRFYEGGDGDDGTGGTFGERQGDPGVGGFVWDGIKPQHAPLARPNHDHITRGGNSFDLFTPGGGGTGCFGVANLEYGPMGWGGHAFGGCAHLTYATSDYDGA